MRIARAALLWAALTLGWCAFGLAGRLMAQEMDQYQQWIHDNASACCDHRDCRPVAVSYTVNGWQVEGTLWPVPVRDVIPWPFAVPYACIAGRRVRCLFMREGM